MLNPNVNKITTSLNLTVPHKGANVKTTQKMDRTMRIIGLAFTYLFLVAMALVVIFPFYYMIIASAMTEEEIVAGHIWPVASNLFENLASNYTETLKQFSYGKYVVNTLVVAFSTTALQLVVTILSAFAFARLEFRGRDILFTCFLATMMIPGEMMTITNYITMNNLGLVGAQQTRIQAYIAMILPFVSSVFYIYLLRQNFKQIPNELYLAAKVDGKSDWDYLWKVMVPLAAPTLITIVILAVIGSWNAYVWPNLITDKKDYWLISVAIRGQALQKEVRPDEFRPQYAWQMCASVLTVVPLLALFIIFRKYIMRGTGRAGLKG